jgi:hypothetical protein
MHDHFEESDGRYAHSLEVVGILLPWFGIDDFFDLVKVEVIESVAGRIDLSNAITLL